MKFMTVLIFSPAVWQSGAGCKASTLQLMQISALQCVFLLFLCSDHEVSLPVSSGPWNLGLLPSGWLQVREVASCRQLVVCMGTGSVSHRPVLMPSVSAGQWLIPLGKLPLAVVSGSFATDWLQSGLQPSCSWRDIDYEQQKT